MPSSDFPGLGITFSYIAITTSVMVEQNSTDTVLPEPQVLLFEHDLRYRNITKEVRIGNAHVAISLMFLILLVGVGVIMHVYRLGPFCHIWHCLSGHSCTNFAKMLFCCWQSLPSSTLQTSSNTAVHVLLFEVVFGSVSWLQPLDGPNVTL